MLPNNWEQFYNDVIARTNRFIEIGYLTIEKSDLINWLKNFKTDEEKFLSGLLIYRLTFRNQKSVLSMLRQVIDIIIPNVLETEIEYKITDLESFHNNLQSPPRNSNLPFRLSTIIIDSEIAKSGPIILRDFQRKVETASKLGYHKNLNISPGEYKDLQEKYPSVKLVFIIDDFLGSGRTFKGFIEKYILENPQLKFVYIPLAAHEKGINNIKDKYPNIILKPIEILTESNSFFAKDLYPSIFQNISEEYLKKLYDDVFLNQGKIKNPYGFGELSTCHSYDDSVPNNMLPIFWQEGLKDWNNLLKR